MKNLLLSSIFMAFLFSSVIAQTDLEFRHFNATNQPIFGGNNFKAAAVTNTGKIWVGSQYHGLVKYDPVTDTWTKSPDILDVSINDIKAANNGGVWIGQSGRQLSQGGSNSVAGGVNYYPGPDFTGMQFYSITSGGNLTSRNVRSIWVDETRKGPDGKMRIWAAQSVNITTNTTSAGGISVGLNTAANYFTKVFNGLQVTPYVSAPNAGLPQCLSVAGSQHEVWVFAAVNFAKSQILRYRADESGLFIGAYDNTNTAALPAGFRANAMYFDNQGRAWVGLSDGGLRIKSGSTWKTMNAAAIFPTGTSVNPNAITSDENGFIYFGTSSGLVVYRGGAVDSVSSYRLITMADGLPTNMINGIAADTAKHRLVLAHNAGISFMNYKKKINVTLDWDFSFPKINVKPIGVTADGVSRLYVKVKRSDSVSLPIKKVLLSIKNMATSAATTIGKLKVATITNQYSNEANTGTAMEVNRTDSTPGGDFYFWYVAPEDFSKDSLSAEASMNERTDSVKVKVTYNDDSVDSSFIGIKVQRPPLMILSAASVAGAAGYGIGRSISSFVQPDSVPFIQSDKFIGKIGVALNQLGSLSSNVARLIDGDLAQNEDKENSYQGLLEGVRKSGFASLRIDVIAQGVSGIVVRATEALKKEKFYADGNYTYNNYGKGYLNKFISIGTPHNGSPVFDAIKEFAPKINEISSKIIAATLKANPEAVQPYEVIGVENASLKIAGELLKKALVDTGGYKLPVTNVKNHLIVTDADATAENPTALQSFGPGFLKISEVLMMAMRDGNSPFKDTLTKVLESVNSVNQKAIKFMSKYAELKGINNFTTDGDLIGSVSSQAAGLLAGAANITKFTNNVSEKVTHTGTFGNRNIASRVYNILNTGIGSNVYANSIPANNFMASVGSIIQKATKVVYDTSKIVILDREANGSGTFRYMGEPANSNNIINDTTVVLKYRVKDTARLQYVYINFQDTMYTSTSKARDQQINLRIKNTMSYSGIQEITAVAVYETTDSVKHHADTLNRFVKIPDTLRGFRIQAEEINLFDGMPYYPAYEVKINEEWQPLPANNPDIIRTIEVAGRVAYDTSRRAFDAASDGYTRVYFQYKTYRDTVAMNCLLPQSAIATNRSISNGNFKDGSTWSKGRPPLPGDSVIISSGHTIVLDTSLQIRSLRIDNGGTFTINNAGRSLQLGDVEDGAFMLDNYGTLNISNGMLKVSGRVKHNSGSAFNMSGGTLAIDGNTGSSANSLANGLFLFEAAPGMSSFSFTNGTLHLIDPPFAVASQALSCPYNFGINSTLMLGNGISITASSNPDGFGGNAFPPQIGKLVLDAGTQGNNRKLKITKPLSVKGSLLIKTGSNMDIQAPVTAAP